MSTLDIKSIPQQQSIILLQKNNLPRRFKNSCTALSTTRRSKDTLAFSIEFGPWKEDDELNRKKLPLRKGRNPQTKRLRISGKQSRRKSKKHSRKNTGCSNKCVKGKETLLQDGFGHLTDPGEHIKEYRRSKNIEASNRTNGSPIKTYSQKEVDRIYRSSGISENLEQSRQQSLLEFEGANTSTKLEVRLSNKEASTLANTNGKERKRPSQTTHNSHEIDDATIRVCVPTCAQSECATRSATSDETSGNGTICESMLPQLPQRNRIFQTNQQKQVREYTTSRISLLDVKARTDHEKRKEKVLLSNKVEESQDIAKSKRKVTNIQHDSKFTYEQMRCTCRRAGGCTHLPSASSNSDGSTINNSYCILPKLDQVVRERRLHGSAKKLDKYCEISRPMFGVGSKLNFEKIHTCGIINHGLQVYQAQQQLKEKRNFHGMEQRQFRECATSSQKNLAVASLNVKNAFRTNGKVEKLIAFSVNSLHGESNTSSRQDCKIQEKEKPFKLTKRVVEPKKHRFEDVPAVVELGSVVEPSVHIRGIAIQA